MLTALQRTIRTLVIKGGENGRDKKNGIQPGACCDLDAGFHQRVFPLDACIEAVLTEGPPFLLDEFRLTFEFVGFDFLQQPEGDDLRGGDHRLVFFHPSQPDLPVHSPF